MSSTRSMEFWIGVGLFVLVWWVLGRPGATHELAIEGLRTALIFACVFCGCRTLLKLVAAIYNDPKP